jgi:metal-responsive CopG/Arc/MetJ family transcriptional regulator
METEQFNIRMPKDLVQDLDVISKLLKVNKSDWVKTKLAEEVHEEKNKLLMELSTLYANGMMSKDKIEQLVGKQIADEMESIKTIAQKSVKHGLEHGKRLKQLHS